MFVHKWELEGSVPMGAADHYFKEPKPICS